MLHIEKSLYPSFPKSAGYEKLYLENISALGREALDTECRTICGQILCGMMQWSCELWNNVPVYPACLHPQCSVMPVCGSIGDTSVQTMLLWIPRWMLVSWHSLVLVTWCCHSVQQLHHSALSWALARWAPFSVNCENDTFTAWCFFVHYLLYT